MARSDSSAVTPLEVANILRRHPRRWVIPMIVGGVLAAVYAVVRTPTWDASQALMVRDETMGATARPGKFLLPDDMKTTQETILELARSRTVIGGALADVANQGSGVGSRESDSHSTTFASKPSDAAIAALQGRVKLVPPKGAEFGKTEVFYLNVEAETRCRAVDLTAAICRQLQSRSQELRDQKAQSLIAELSKTADLAKADLDTTTAALTAVETRIGADLGELRVLNEVGGGDSPLRRSINELDQELRQARQAIDSNRELLALLETSKTDANSLVAAPNRLLEAQPVLRRLKDGLVDAQLRTSQLEGNMTANHPSVVAAKESEAEITQQVRGEIDSAILGVQTELRLSQERADSLEANLTEARRRLAKLAEIRADYANIVADRNQRADILKTAQQQLAEARASQAAAVTASLIAAIDTPVAGDAPVGPGKSTIALGGLLGGLVAGLGIVFLTVQPVQTEIRLAESLEGVSEGVVGRVPNTAAIFENFSAKPTPAPVDVPLQVAPVLLTNGFSLPNGHSLSLKQALGKLAAAR
jgi:hypothetical protein